MKSKFSFVLLGLVILQLIAGSWHINYPFVDGRVHYNWGPAFWLLQAEKLNQVGLNSTYWGVKDYPAHPQLIGPVLSLWTKSFGYSESSIRILCLVLSILATLFLSLAVNEFIGKKRSVAFYLIFSSLPLIYIYGRKLDQEALVLLFLSIYIYGIAKINNSEKYGYIISTFGSLGMALSDWSGLVFSGIISLISIIAWGWKNNKQRIIKFGILSIGASVLGLFIFLLQSYLQEHSPGISVFFKNYYELWKYRAGFGQTITWSRWFVQQLRFLTSNYSIPLTLLSFIGIFAGIKNKVEVVNKNYKTFSWFIFGVLISEIFYMVFLKQASGIHIYYQYFLSVPIAFGLILLIDMVFNKEKAWMWAVGILFLFLALFSRHQFYNLLFKDSGGDISDITLIKEIKNIPQNMTVIAAEINQLGIFWYDNPNIQYYSGRTIKGYLLEDGVPISDYQIVPKSQSNDYSKAINDGGYGPRVYAREIKCSKNLCLLQLTKK